MVRIVLQYSIVRPMMQRSRRPNIGVGLDDDKDENGYRKEDFRTLPNRLGGEPSDAPAF